MTIEMEAPVGAATVSSAIPGKAPGVAAATATEGPALVAKSCHPSAYRGAKLVTLRSLIS